MDTKMTLVDWLTVSAAWLQAVGSVVAIIVAIVVGRRSDKRARDLVESERLRQASIAASTVAMRLENIAREARQKINLLAQVRAKSDEASTVLLRSEAGLRNCMVLTREHLKAEFRAWTLLFDKDNGIKVSIALDFVETYNTTIEGSIGFFIATGQSVDGFLKLCDTAIERLGELADSLEETFRDLEASHELSAEGSADAH